MSSAGIPSTMTQGKKEEVPRAVIRRLTKYLAHLQAFDGRRWVSSSELADSLELTSATVRRDLAHLDFSGVAHRGYEVEGLYDGLSSFLGADSSWKAVVVGAGNLGKAVALHGEWTRRGFDICAIFDTDRRKIGRRVGTLQVMPLNRLPSTIANQHVDIGVIAVPADAAQSVADLMIVGGVRGILNLSLTHIFSPEHVEVNDVRLVASMIELGHGIKRRTAALPAGE